MGVNIRVGAALLLAYISGTHCTFWYSNCPYKDTSPSDPRICGSDGETYSSLCDFKQVQSIYTSLHIVHPGPCRKPLTAETAADHDHEEKHKPLIGNLPIDSQSEEDGQIKLKRTPPRHTEEDDAFSIPYQKYPKPGNSDENNYDLQEKPVKPPRHSEEDHGYFGSNEPESDRSQEGYIDFAPHHKPQHHEPPHHEPSHHEPSHHEPSYHEPPHHKPHHKPPHHKPPHQKPHVHSDEDHTPNKYKKTTPRYSEEYDSYEVPTTRPRRRRTTTPRYSEEDDYSLELIISEATKPPKHGNSHIDFNLNNDATNTNNIKIKGQKDKKKIVFKGENKANNNNNIDIGRQASVIIPLKKKHVKM